MNKQQEELVKGLGWEFVPSHDRKGPQGFSDVAVPDYWQHEDFESFSTLEEVVAFEKKNRRIIELPDKPVCTCNLPNGQLNPAFDCVLHEAIITREQKLRCYPKLATDEAQDDLGWWAVSPSGREPDNKNFLDGYNYRRLRPTSEIKLGKTGVAGQTDLPEQPLDCPIAQAREGGEDNSEHMVENEVFGAYLIHNTACKLIGESAHELDKYDAGYKIAAIRCAQKHLSIVSNLERERDDIKNTHSTLLVALEYNRKERDELKQSLAASQVQVAELVKALEYCRNEARWSSGDVVPMIDSALALTPSKALEKYQRMEKALKMDVCGQSLMDYLHYQYPAMRGDIPLRAKIIALQEALNND
jgi:hypothetical protein